MDVRASSGNVPRCEPHQWALTGQRAEGPLHRTRRARRTPKLRILCIPHILHNCTRCTTAQERKRNIHLVRGHWYVTPMEQSALVDHTKIMRTKEMRQVMKGALFFLM